MGIQAFTTYKKLCEYYNIPKDKFNNIRRTYPTISLNSLVERATGVTLPDNLKIVRGLLYNGTVYDNYITFCKQNQLDYNRFKQYQNEHKCLNDEQLINKYMSDNLISYEDNLYPSYRKLCKHYGVNYKTFLNRKKAYPNRDIKYWLFKKNY